MERERKGGKGEKKKENGREGKVKKGKEKKIKQKIRKVSFSCRIQMLG